MLVERSSLGVVAGIVKWIRVLFVYPPYLGSSTLPWYNEDKAW